MLPINRPPPRAAKPSTTRAYTRYYVRLTSEQNERFLRMYEQSGMKNKADFICHRIFG